MIEGFIVIGMIILVILTFGKPLLAVFDNDPEVITLGYTRLVFIMITHVFILIYEVLSGYLRGFGISFTPVVLTMLGVCDIRIGWIQMVFPLSGTFKTIMIVSS